MPNIPGLNAARVRFFDDGHRVLPLTKLTEKDRQALIAAGYAWIAVVRMWIKH